MGEGLPLVDVSRREGQVDRSGCGLTNIKDDWREKRRKTE